MAENSKSRVDEKWLAEHLAKNPSLRARNKHLLAPLEVVYERTPDEITKEAAAMLEAELQSNVRKVALANGFLYYHTHDSRKSDPGFLDTVLLRVGIKCDLLFVECKREGETPSKDQQRWIKALEVFINCANYFEKLPVTMEVHVWYPTDWLTGVIEKRLATL